MLPLHRVKPTRWKAQCRTVAAVGVLFAMIATGLTQSLPEASVKAAFVARFAEFVAWPPPDGGSGGALRVCLSPSHPFGSRVREVTRDSRVRGRSVAVRDLAPGANLGECDVLYVAPADIELLQRVQRLPILTIGDQPGFCRLGGIINLRVIDRRVRFEVGLDHARRVGLSLDPQLLRLAVAVYGGPQ